MPEENFLFLPVKNFCRRNVTTCSPEDNVLQVAAAMRDNSSSSTVVCEDGKPVGILTDRDLRNKVVAHGIDPGLIAASDIMNAPLITVREEDLIFEALYRISRNNIHRVCVVDEEYQLIGVITDSDILRLQTNSPQQLVMDIEDAETIDDLKELHKQIQRLVLHLVGTGVLTCDLVTMIAHLNDQLLLRLITLLRAEQFRDLPDGFAFIVLGSEGRSEQTLTTDQDNAIIYDDDLSPEEVSQIEAFSVKLIDTLIEVGVPACPGGIMAKNEFWRRSFSAWTDVLHSWMDKPVNENILNGSMFFDLRTIYGDESLERRLKDHLAEYFKHYLTFLRRSAANVLRFKTPVGMFGHIKVERKGEHRGKLDIKKAGIFAITEGVKALAMQAGIMDGGTRERIHALAKAGVFKQNRAEDLEASYNFLVFLRLRCQVDAIRAGKEPTNYITFAKLNHMERGRLKLAFEEVSQFQEMLEVHFRVNLLR
jgi:CBS domain-containing protein